LTSILKGIAHEKNQEGQLVDILKGITASIFTTVNLNDIDTRKQFRPYMAYLDGQKDLEVLKNCTASVEGGDIYDHEIQKVWKLRVSETKISAFEVDITRINFDKLPLFFEYLAEAKSLESLLLYRESENYESPAEALKKISSLSQLKKLDISEFLEYKMRKFTFEQIESVFKNFSQLRNLTSLKISQSYFLVNNFDKINEISECIEKYLKWLTHLSISDFKFNRSKIKLLSKILPKLKHLTSLDLSCDSSAGFDGFEKFTDALGSMPQLTELTLSYLKLDDENNAENLALALGELKILKTLNIAIRDLNPKAIYSFVSAFERLQQLTEISLSISILSDDDSMDLLLIHISRLFYLKVVNVDASSLKLDSLLCFLRNLKNARNLRSLTISNLRSLSNEETEKFLSVLEDFDQLEDFQITFYSKADNHCLQQIFRCLKRIKNLKTAKVAAELSNFAALSDPSLSFNDLPSLKSLVFSFIPAKKHNFENDELESFSKQCEDFSQKSINFPLSIEFDFSQSTAFPDPKLLLESIRKIRNLTSLVIAELFFENYDVLKYTLEILNDLKSLTSLIISNPVHFCYSERIKKIRKSFPNLKISTKGYRY
jgi:hypothetical protein